MTATVRNVSEAHSFLNIYLLERNVSFTGRDTFLEVKGEKLLLQTSRRNCCTERLKIESRVLDNSENRANSLQIKLNSIGLSAPESLKK